jgi:hypothetical protein
MDAITLGVLLGAGSFGKLRTFVGLVVLIGLACRGKSTTALMSFVQFHAAECAGILWTRCNH